ncbi:hypothetical protein TUM4636_16200 [Shewanella glacialipiscicola]|uniref:Uncharacterized protein n=1 Tax=Shewanella glacialipiscicola TaxID=614069 RepID=A0ABQ6J5W5_9GAMM|nr:hypothetical protein TUM4636_16200 [Shewanella glacialipiscicola]GMA83533.1 hypothetical protein GCM10025855_30660 [Shewanella glacialipiscicola]
MRSKRYFLTLRNEFLCQIYNFLFLSELAVDYFKKAFVKQMIININPKANERSSFKQK